MPFFVQNTLTGVEASHVFVTSTGEQETYWSLLKCLSASLVHSRSSSGLGFCTI